MHSSYFTKPRNQLEAVEAKDIAISVDKVSMVFNVANQRLTNLKEYFISLIKHELLFKEFIALEDISFEVEKGDVFGILGVNGSGKSTLLKIIAGVLEPTKGTIRTKGRISPLIELGAGFDFELTARENIYLNGSLLGYPKKYIDEHLDEIITFSEMEDFLEMPLKNYSSGMVARVAFAIATVMVPDILIVDEVLSVGDFVFKQKCEHRIRELIEDHGTTVLIVSHSDNQIEELCNKALWIDHGQMKMVGNARDVCRAYRLLGGGEVDQEVETTLLDTLSTSGDQQVANSAQTISIKDRYEMATELERLTFLKEDINHVVIASGSQFDTRIMATAFAHARNAPLILVSPTGLNGHVITYLCEMKPSSITIINRKETGTQISFDIESQISSYIDCDITILEEESFEELSRSLYHHGQTLNIWGGTALTGCPTNCISLLSAFPFFSDKKPFVYLHDKEARSFQHSKNETIPFEKFDIISFEELDANVSNEEQTDDALSYQACKDNYRVIEALSADSNSPSIIFASSRNLSHAISALQFACSRNGLIMLYDPIDPKYKAEAVRVLNRWDISNPKLVFLGAESDFCSIDKELLTKAARS